MLFVGAAAQSALPIQGDISKVEVVGTSDPTLASLVKVNLVARPGVPVASVDLEAERNRVLSMGTFSQVSVDIEEQNGSPVLVVHVTPNPKIGAVEIKGSRYPSADLLKLLDQYELIKPGVTYNTNRAQDARTLLQQIYQQKYGWPFAVPVSLAVTPMKSGAASGGSGGAAQTGQAPVKLTYTVTEKVPLDKVVFKGDTVLSQDTLKKDFQALENAKTFDYDAYLQSVQAVGQDYDAKGYKGSGVNIQKTALAGGTLMVQLQELKIGSIDTTAIGVNPSKLSLQPGDLFNYDTLLADVKKLAKGRTEDIRLETQQTDTGEVRVTFKTGPPASAGPIKNIKIEGNTVISGAQLKKLLSLHVGDTFTSALAQQDFNRIEQYYQKKGYRLVNKSDFNYIDGTYVQRVDEVKIAGYKVEFQSQHPRTKPTVVTRYMPKVGSVFNTNALLRGLQAVAQINASNPPLTPQSPQLAPTKTPDEIIVVLPIKENAARTFQPGLTYSTNAGLSADISYSDTNFLGRANVLGAEVTAQTSDIGFLFGGNVHYSVPWLYIDALDFKEVPTSFSVSLFSNVTTNQPLSANGKLKVTDPNAPCQQMGTCKGGKANDVFVGEYTQRDTGLSFSVGRRILTNTFLHFAARGAYTDYKLEPGKPCEYDASGNVKDSACALDRKAVLDNNYLPQSGLESFVSTNVTFDSRDNPNFPTEGLAASGTVGVGFGNNYRNSATKQQQAYHYEQLELGFSTYATLQHLFPAVVTNPSHVLAFRVNFGHQFGSDYPTSKYFIVGNTPNQDTQIRGYARSDFNPSQTYATGSFEYRYNFGLSTIVTQTVIGFAFVDLGYASSVPDFPDYQTPLFAGAGLGVQINLGFSGVALPAVRLSYGFSQRHPTGVFSFGIGPEF
jgi:outer membrane protein insertion porin family